MTRYGRQSAAILTGALVVLAGLFAMPAKPGVIRADGEEMLIDSDGDFLPDVVEWAVLTDANNPDTDGDQCPDFVEVVQRGSPRHPGIIVAQDHALRVVMTGPPPGTNDPTWLHLFFRFCGNASLMTSFATWIELPAYPGLQLPLNVLGFANTVLRDRQTANEGYWMQVSVPMVSEGFLRQFLPCSIRAEATIDGAVVSAGVRLVDVGAVTCSLVPYGDGRHVLQSIGPQPLVLPASNRVCLLTLEPAGVGPGGVLYEVVDADCESCNELECGPTCQQSEGWFIMVPGGLGTL